MHRAVEDLETAIDRAEGYHTMLVKAAERKQSQGPPTLVDVETQTYEEELATFFPVDDDDASDDDE